MPAILTTILGLLASAPVDIAAATSAWANIRGLFSTQTQAQIDALLAPLNSKTDTDLQTLETDAQAGAQA